MPELIVVVGKNVKYSHLRSYSSGLALGPAEIPPSVQAAKGPDLCDYKVKTITEILKYIHLVRLGSKTF